MDRLAGRVALITGAASGVGRATAERLTAEGAAVIITDANDEDGKTVAGALDALGRRVAYLHLDVMSAREWLRAVEGAVGQFGGLDILVNNAGGHGELNPAEKTSPVHRDRSVAVLQTGMFIGLKHAAPALLQSGHASVVNISSILAAHDGFGTPPACPAATSAVGSFTKTTALHWAQQGIRVNSVHPGFIDTRRSRPGSVPGQPGSAEIHQSILEFTPLGRLGRPEDVAAAVAYLASDDAAFVTGSEFYIDGGLVARGRQ